MNFSEWQHIATAARVGEVSVVKPLQHSDHQQCWQLTTGKDHYFVKTMLKRYSPMLIAEAHSLSVLSQTQTLRCPLVIAQGETIKTAWLMLEWIPLNETGNQTQLGQQLAALHRQTAVMFGWSETNFIEQGIQYNHPLDDWASFYRAQRLMPQLRRAKEQGLSHSIVLGVEALINRLDHFFIDHKVKPSLLHGNLSVDNIRYLNDGSPLALNPSSSYADREMDIAMSELSNGFSEDFYAAYREAYPLEPDYEQRKPLYQLYYQLNRFNQFGGNFNTQIQSLLNDLH